MKFVKMHGTGNDYIYIDMTTNYYKFDPADLSRKISDRHFGVGSDGLILVHDSKTDAADFRMRIFNPDGSEAEMCGNGIRAFAKYLYEHRLTNKKTLRIETPAGIKIVELVFKGGSIWGAKVDMGEPILEGSRIPVTVDKNPVVNEELSVDSSSFKFTAVSMGNPHCIIFTDELTDELVKGIGSKIETHSLFPKKINVEFVKVLDSSHIEMRVWERGTGETMACGTGASAAAVACSLNGKTGKRIHAKVLGGELQIEWAANNHVYMTGPAEEVFEGVYNYQAD
ncbi:diaminopimelate epimerase [Candidatus Woesearchaeota archaeon]|nr:diaminopimelate epimerase [Candidatus Woesearchaeota archaeon]